MYRCSQRIGCTDGQGHRLKQRDQETPPQPDQVEEGPEREGVRDSWVRACGTQTHTRPGMPSGGAGEQSRELGHEILAVDGSTQTPREKGQAWASVLRALWDQGQNEGGVRVGLCYLPGKRRGDGNIEKAVL